MSVITTRPFKGYTLNEGYTNLGTLQFDVTPLEFDVFEEFQESPNKPKPSTKILFSTKYSTGEPLPAGYVYELDFMLINTPAVVFTDSVISTREEFVEYNFPGNPFIKKNDSGIFIIDLRVEGAITARDQECYIEVKDSSDNSYYTLITDLVVNDDYLCIFDGDETYYKLADEFEIITEDIDVIVINQFGAVLTYNPDTQIWANLGKITFNQIEFPEELDEFSDGFYETNVNTGTITQGHLGDDASTFENFVALVENTSSYYVKVKVEIFEPVAKIPVLVYETTINSIFIGSPDVNIITIPGSPEVPEDESPDLDDIETVSGETFSTALVNFINTEEINSLKKLRASGPIRYIDGMPTEGITEPELTLLQAHIDLYIINENIDENQHLIDEGYDSLFKIASTPKDKFLEDTVGEDLDFYHAAKMHEEIVQTQKLLSNVLSARMSDYGLKTNMYPALPNSNFEQEVFASFINKCDCDDCSSAISPFAYMVDLIKYGANTVRKTGTNAYAPVNYTQFLTLLETYFLQPFGTLSVSCSTLNTQFCRVRLVTEVLEKFVAEQTLPQPVLDQLEADRNDYLLVTYKTILNQAGTSFQELRDVVKMQPEEEKLALAERWSTKMGIPLIVPGETELLTADRIWLTFDNTDPDYDLNAENLELIFGFRDTLRDVLTNTPDSLMNQWRAAHLRDLWRIQDYPFTSYSREYVDPENPATFKANWKPLIDPDNVGPTDMTYHTSEFASELWRHRKADIDKFLNHWITVTGFLSRTSADINKRILRVADRDITTHVIEADKVYINHDPDPITYHVLNKTLINLDTDVILRKSTIIDEVVTLEPDMEQPDGAEPVMRYNRVLNVPDGIEIVPVGGIYEVTIDFDEDVVFQDVLTGGVLKLISSASGEIYTNYLPEEFYEISEIDFETPSKITFEIDFKNDTFFEGSLQLIYEVEVPLYTTEIPNPNLICEVLFEEDSSTYPFLDSEITSFDYTVWDLPDGWTVETGYTKLKELNSIIQSGQATDADREIITSNLHLNAASFAKMMELFMACENYLNSTFTFERPTTEALYTLTSIFRVSAKFSLQSVWVDEEITYDPESTSPANLMLNGQYFWKALQSPIAGAWDPSLQTIPETVGEINRTHIPIIDPELLPSAELLPNPEAEIYRELYDDRKIQLETQFNAYLDKVIPFEIEGFEKILNHINTDDYDTDYDVSPYADLDALITAFESTDPFSQHEAAVVLNEAFGLSASDFSVILPIKRAYENENPESVPTAGELKKATRLLVSGYKRVQLYPTTDGWIEEEITGDFDGGNEEMVMYYNVRKMRMAAERSSTSERNEWQRTLAAWNRTPAIHPDLVPPENIKEFVSGEAVHDIWVNRFTDLADLTADMETLFNSSITPIGDLLSNLELLLAMAVARTDDDTIEDAEIYLNYFLNIQPLEESGEDIRPYLNQLGILITEYRVLRKIYDIVKQAAEIVGEPDLLDSEYDDVVNILVQIHSRNIMPFAAIQEEFEEDVILCGDEFQNFKSQSISFPINLVTPPQNWRAPHSEVKAWKDKLTTRVERDQRVIDAWKEILLEAEEITMPLMRDALIQALRNECESFDATAERLAKTLFIETKDNCCVKHSRVSFAIETLQGFIFSLQSGVYDEYLNGFSISAPNFKREWEWIGSYATWRSAVFVFIYPENLLYPTLKRLQSPAFLQLSDTINNSNRFSPDDACRAAKRFQLQFEDLQHLKMVCTTNAEAYFYRKDPFDCCGDQNNSISRYTTFYFAESTISGKLYWSEKPFYFSEANDHSFWEELPLPDGAHITGCYVLAREYDTDGHALDRALWLFYTYKEKGELKLAYLKKDLTTAGSRWTEEESIDAPDLLELSTRQVKGLFRQREIEQYVRIINSFRTDAVNIIDENTYLQSLTYYTSILTPGDMLVKITSCQHTIEWDYPSFIFSFQCADKIKHLHVRYDHENENFHVELGTVILFETTDTLPITALRHQIPSANGVEADLYGVTVVFENEIQTGYYGSLNATNTSYGVINPNVSSPFTSLIGCFHKNNASEKLVVVEKDVFGNIQCTEVKFTFTTNNIGNSLTMNTTLLTSGAMIQQIKSIAPTFKQSSNPGACAVHAYSTNAAVGLVFEIEDTDIFATHTFGLAIEEVNLVPIESVDCIDNMDLRTQQIKAHLRANLNAPQGNPIGQFTRTDKVREYLYEAYYFVPMLIALDQQQRGQYDAALSWYRSAYDYANNLANKRKIFYGLVLEQSIVNIYQRPADWLLDPLNPHLIAQTRANAYTKYTIMNIIQCLLAYADREFTLDTIESVPRARKLYSEALSLLKVSELNLRAPACNTIINNCFPQDIALPYDKYWNNTFEELQQKMAELPTSVLVETAADEIKSIFDDGELDIEEKFTAAFDYLDANAPAPGTPESVVELIEGFGERMDNSFRFIFAQMNLQPFNTAVGTRFDDTVAELSFVDPATLEDTETEDQISWLENPVKNNSEPYGFEFMDNTGKQLLPEDYAYNPLVRSRKPFMANMVYTNAPEMYAPALFPESYMPLIDYRFCMPKNPVYSALELKANLELFKIQNCRNIAGMVRELDIFAAATDSTTGVPVIGAGGSLILPGLGTFTPSQYRFRVLMERAKQLVQLAQQLESQFLSTLEKEDAENYTLMKARQDLRVTKETVRLQDMRVRQANNELGMADLQLDKVEFSFDHFSDLISEGMNIHEIMSLVFLGISTTLYASAAAVSYFSTDSVSAMFSSSAQAASTNASILAQFASYERRKDEWQYQKDLAGHDISIANQQIKIANQNIRIVGQEREISQLNNDHAEDTLEFLKTKFTNAELYRWMGNVLERSYGYMLSLATAVAKTAEGQFYFEQQEQAGPFILDDYWDAPQSGGASLSGESNVDRRGLTGSARLLQDLYRLDQFAFERTKRKLQMTKMISLAQNFPEEFQSFRDTGVMNFQLTTELFDYDFPGQYLRLINGVKASVIGLVPVNDGIKATLTAGATSYTVIEANNMYQRIPIRRMEIEQVALTAPMNTNGLFELQPMQGELLNPFEGMGIESQWEFKMPKFSNRMDYSQIADVLVEVEYTAMDSFQYRYQVLQDLDNTYRFSRGFSFKNDFPDQWYELAEALPNEEQNTDPITVEFELKRENFPQGVNDIRLDGSDILLHFVRQDGFTEEIHVVDFNLADAEGSELSGLTVNGTLKADALTNVLDGNPMVRLRLSFDNTILVREMFSEGKIQDILLLVSCRADLPTYPL